jgi:hypothetical protein
MLARVPWTAQRALVGVDQDAQHQRVALVEPHAALAMARASAKNAASSSSPAFAAPP